MDNTAIDGMKTAGCQGATTVSMARGTTAMSYVLAFGDGTAYLCNLGGVAGPATCRSGLRGQEMSPTPDVSPVENAC
jgi:hypothetical protein